MLESRNYVPSAVLAPFVRRHYIFRADLPAEFELVDHILPETAFIRLLIAGDWAAKMPDGTWAQFGPCPLVGSCSQPLCVRVRGGFIVVGVSLRPGGWPSLFRQPASVVSDRVVATDDLWDGDAERLHRAVADAGNDDLAMIAVVEAALLARIAALGNISPSEPMLAFEEIAQQDCTVRVTDAADRLELSVRQLERHCHATFGHAPKMVLRRARFLDMAQALRGFGSPSQEHLAALGYIDQSHRNREFRHFFGMTAGKFEKAVTPLFTAGLKLRSEGLY
ncbi:helix-turn-helix domain-containing protein [Sphingobium sp. CR28]|uniref:helix-turn-helix domain-containing protein n=1 Tax=Sphingobium sp. CR28 TaxID=3400272 RepID=UPI003FF0EA46